MTQATSTTLTLSNIEREALANGVHEALRCNCDSGDADRMIVDGLASAVESIVAGRLAEALAPVRALVAEWERLRADDTLAYASRYIADLRAALPE